MAIPRHRSFAREETAPSYWANRIQERLGPLTNLRLRKFSNTAIEAVAGSGEDASVLSIDGRWRWNEASVQRTISGPAGMKAIFAIALDNDVNSTPEPNTDNTVFSYSLRVVPDGTTPAIVPGDVEIFRRIGRVPWDGSAISGPIVQEVGIVGGPQLADDVIDAGAAIPSLRTLGAGAQQAAPGDRTFGAGPLASRPAAASFPGGRWLDEFGTEWRSDGTTWLAVGGKLPYAHCEGGTSVPHNTTTDLALGTEVEDLWAMHAAGSASIIVPYDGVYDMAAYATVGSVGSTTSPVLTLLADATTLAAYKYRTSAADSPLLPLAATRRLAAGTAVKLTGYHAQGSGTFVTFTSTLVVAMQSS